MSKSKHKPAQKILFFYGYPNLVSLRSQIVNNICLYSAGK